MKILFLIHKHVMFSLMYHPALNILMENINHVENLVIHENIYFEVFKMYLKLLNIY